MMDESGEALEVSRVYWDEGYFVVVESDGRTRRLNPNAHISGVSLGNLNFAIIEPRLFTFTILKSGVLHVVCPYTKPHTPTVSVYLGRVTAGFIRL